MSFFVTFFLDKILNKILNKYTTFCPNFTIYLEILWSLSFMITDLVSDHCKAIEKYEDATSDLKETMVTESIP